MWLMCSWWQRFLRLCVFHEDRSHSASQLPACRKEANPTAAHTLTSAPQLLCPHSTNFPEKSATHRGCGAAGDPDVAPSLSLHAPPHSLCRCLALKWRKCDRLPCLEIGRREGSERPTYSSSCRELGVKCQGQESKRPGAWPILTLWLP